MNRRELFVSTAKATLAAAVGGAQLFCATRGFHDLDLTRGQQRHNLDVSL